MAINAQSGQGKIRLFDDFFGGYANANTLTIAPIGPFSVLGDGIDETDSGALLQTSDCLSGKVRLTTTNEDNHACGIGTGMGFNVALMAPIVLEARVQFNNLDTKDAFIGFSDICASNMTIEGGIGKGDTTTLTLTASDICGFYLSAELTASTAWHAMFNGGTTTGVTVSTSNTLGVNATAGEWQVLRLEIDPDATVRWFIDGVLKKTVENAVSKTVDLAAFCGVGAKGAAIEEMDVDYLLIEANRDWNA